MRLYSETHTHNVIIGPTIGSPFMCAHVSALLKILILATLEWKETFHDVRFQIHGVCFQNYVPVAFEL